MAGWDMGIARTIVDVGMSLGANETQLLAALSTALVESGMQNVSHGDRDSLGVFQQRPSMAWGTPQQVQDPTYAARAFFTGAGTNRGALAYSDWSGTPGQLAQRVQRSAFPERYDQRLGEARQILDQLRSGAGQQVGAAQEQGRWQRQSRDPFDAQRTVNGVLQALSEQVRSGGLGSRIPGLDEDLNATRAPGGVDRAGTPEWWAPNPQEGGAVGGEEAMQALADQLGRGIEDVRAMMDQLDQGSYLQFPGEQGQTADQMERAIKQSGSSPLAWGGHSNGRIPLAELTEVAPGQRLRSDAAAAYEAMRRAAAAEGVTIAAPTDTYRDYEGQVSVRRRKGHQVATATPGTSVHGWALAIDQPGDKARQWIQRNGARYGWVWPEWAQRKGTKSYEPWHFEYRGGGAPQPHSATPRADAAAPTPRQMRPRRSTLPSTSRTAGSQWKGRV